MILYSSGSNIDRAAGARPCQWRIGRRNASRGPARVTWSRPLPGSRDDHRLLVMRRRSTEKRAMFFIEMLRSDPLQGSTCACVFV